MMFQQVVWNWPGYYTSQWVPVRQIAGGFYHNQPSVKYGATTGYQTGVVNDYIVNSNYYPLDPPPCNIWNILTVQTTAPYLGIAEGPICRLRRLLLSLRNYPRRHKLLLQSGHRCGYGWAANPEWLDGLHTT